MADRLVPVREPRTRVERLADGVRVSVPPRRSVLAVFAAGWVVVVVVIGLVAMILGDEPTPLGFVAAWVGWGGLIAGLAAWSTLARETLTLDRRTLVHERRLGPLARRRAYDRASVQDVRISPAPALSPWDLRNTARMFGTAGVVAFDYGDRTVRVADTEEAEAKRVVAALRESGL